MKVKVFFVFCYLFYSFGYAQEYEDLYKKISNLKYSYEYDEIDCEIIDATKYILEQPYEEEVLKNNFAYKSLMKWMDSTEVYHVIAGGKILEHCDKGSVLYNMSKISMTQYIFDNDSIVQTSISRGFRYVNIHRVREIIYGGGEIFMEYLNKQKNKTIKAKINKSLKKGLKQYREGQFETFMSYKKGS